MARTWGNKLDDIANINMMIANTRGAGGSPGQSYQRPLQNPDPGEAVFGVEKGGQGFFEFLKAMGLNKNNKGMTIAHGEGRGPQPKHHDEYNQPLKFPPWVQMNEAGELIEIPWMKEEYLKEHPNLKISGATSRQIRDKLKPYTRGGPADYDKEGGSLRDLPASLRIKLLKA